MNVVFNRINESDFYEIHSPILFNDIKTSRCFGIITNNVTSYLFSWQSDIQNPVLNEISEGICSIGIDQNFAIINFVTAKIILNIELTYPFYDNKVYGNYCFVITELEIIRIDIINFGNTKEYMLPDIFEEINFGNNQVEVKCSGNITLLI
jgi:hypothetical protein